MDDPFSADLRSDAAAAAYVRLVQDHTAFGAADLLCSRVHLSLYRFCALSDRQKAYGADESAAQKTVSS